MLAQQIASGLATGSLYALTAIGIVLIFRNTRTINLAQGDFSMIGAFVALTVLGTSRVGLLGATAITIAAVTVLAGAVERLIMRPIEQADWLTLFTATLGVFYIRHGAAGWIWGRDTKSFPALFPSAPVSIGGTLISQAHLFNILVAAVIGALLYAFFRFTKPGIAMRAITEDPIAAQLMGIPVRRIVVLTWAVGGVLAAISGVLLAPLVYVSTQMMCWRGAAESGNGQDITISQQDIRQLQLAKGAIYSGILMLKKVMALDDPQLQELMLAGGFGNYINIESAVRIRLLPDLPLEKIRYVGNAAALGAQLALLSETERDRATALARRIEHVSLAARPDFQSLFIEAICFPGDANADILRAGDA